MALAAGSAVGMFAPSRLVVARGRRELTPRALAQFASVPLPLITAYEAGLANPDTAMVAGLATSLRFPVAFLTAADIDLPRLDHASGRKLAAVPGTSRESVAAAVALGLELQAWVDDHTQDRPQLPDARGTSPETAADAVRHLWSLSTGPVTAIRNLLETAGIATFWLPARSADVDAVSFWRAGRPYIFLAPWLESDDMRFAAARELGHLLLHRHSEGVTADADAFARAILLPRRDLRAAFADAPSVGVMNAATGTWGVSLALLIHRLHDIGLVDDASYAHLCVAMIATGGTPRLAELQPQCESSMLLSARLADLRARGFDRPEIADEIHVPVGDIEELLFGLRIAPVDADGEALTPPRGHLRSVP